MEIFNELINFLFVFMPVILLISIFAYRHKQYEDSAYYQITKNPYASVRCDKGKYGEYLIYKSLRGFESKGVKILFNIYLPKDNYETTEIDALLICSKGLFVFESKNYSGWIFGNEDHKNWTQTLPIGRGRSHKERFYNPITQNKLHIKHLKNLIGEYVPMRSIIVFSDRCTLKNITIKSSDVNVIKNYSVAFTVSQICNQIQGDLLTEEKINEIYNKLYPYTQVDLKIKEQHAEKIRNKREVYD